jgi:uncharacterized protein YciI
MYFAVISQQGPGWDVSRGMREQDRWPEHVDFINGLVDRGFLLLGGPIGDGNPYRAMLIVNAESEAEVVSRLGDDPWRTAGVLELAKIDRWDVLVGEFGSA